MKILWMTLQVLTMEYAPGVKINRTAEIEAMGIDRKLLAQRTVESYLQQLLTFGFFHAGAQATAWMEFSAYSPGVEVVFTRGLKAECMPQSLEVFPVSNACVLRHH